MRALASASWRLLPTLPAFRGSLTVFRTSLCSTDASVGCNPRPHVQTRSLTTAAAGGDGGSGIAADATSTQSYKEWRAQWNAFLDQLFEQVSLTRSCGADHQACLLHQNQHGGATLYTRWLAISRPIQRAFRCSRALLQGHFSADPGVRSDALAVQPGPMKRAVLSLGRQRGDILYCLEPAKLRALVVAGFPVDDRKVRDAWPAAIQLRP